MFGGILPRELYVVGVILFLQVKISSDLFIISGLRMRRSLVILSGLVKSVTKMVTGCLRTMV